MLEQLGDATFIAGIAGIIVSALMYYVKPFAAWLETLNKPQKRLFFLGVMAAVAIGMWALGCSPFGPEYGLECPTDVTATTAAIVKMLVTYFLAGVGGTQTAYTVFKQLTPSKG